MIATMLDRMSYGMLILLAIAFAIVPIGRPHLFEKLGMLFSGTLRRPLDWFDLFMHAAPLALLLAKIGRDLVRRAAP